MASPATAPSSSVPALEVRSLVKSYGEIAAVKGISFTVRRGEIVGLLGPNGAGKTTTIDMLLGVLKPTSGSVHIEGDDIAARRSETIGKTNFAAVYAQLPGNLTVWQNLNIFALLYGVPRRAARIAELIKEFDLVPFADTRCGVLSSGEQTRVSLAKAMLNRPHLLLLDEPTASLAPSTAQIIREKIKAFAASDGGGVLWTSHNMQEVTEVCDRILFLSRGAILLEGDPRTLPGEHGKKDLEELFISIAREPLLHESL